MLKIFSCLLKQAGLTAAIITTTAGATHALPFEDVTEKTGLSGLSKSTAAWVDFNNDGFVDLYNDGKLWRNVKGERFELVKDTPFTGRGTWADYDRLIIATGARARTLPVVVFLWRFDRAFASPSGPLTP